MKTLKDDTSDKSTEREAQLKTELARVDELTIVVDAKYKELRKVAKKLRKEIYECMIARECPLLAKMNEWSE